MLCRISFYDDEDDCYPGLDEDGNYVLVTTDGQTGEVLGDSNLNNSSYIGQYKYENDFHPTTVNHKD